MLWCKEINYSTIRSNLLLSPSDVTLSRSWKWQNEIPFGEKANLHIWHVDSREEYNAESDIVKKLCYSKVDNLWDDPAISHTGTIESEKAKVIWRCRCKAIRLWTGNMVGPPLMREKFHFHFKSNVDKLGSNQKKCDARLPWLRQRWTVILD